MPDRPADVRGREHRLPGAHVVDRPHRQGQRHRVAADVALHALRLAGRARGVEQIARLVRLQPFHRHRRTVVARAQFGVVEVAAGHARQIRIESAADDQHVRRRRLRRGARRVDQRFVRDHLAAAHAGIGADQQLRLRVVDAQSQVVRGEAAEHDRMDRADARAGEHGEHRLRHVRHVDHHAIAAADAERLQHRGERVHFAMQFAIGDLVGEIRFGRHRDQRELVAARVQVPVDRVVAEVGLAADEPAPERRVRVVEDALRRLVPVDRPGLFRPERLRLLHGLAIQLVVGRHRASPGASPRKPRGRRARGGYDLGRGASGCIPAPSLEINYPFN